MTHQDNYTFTPDLMNELIDKPDDEISEADFLDMIKRIPQEPNIEVLN